MTNTEAIDNALGKGKGRCMWQVSPNELPEDMPTLGLELWQTEDGTLHLFQLFPKSRGDDWFMELLAVTHFVHKTD